MPKRKRGTEMAGEPSAPPPSRKSARLLGRESHQKGKHQSRVNGPRRALPSPSTTGLTREDRCHTQLSEDNTKKSIKETSFESHSAGHKRKADKEPDQTGTESRKRPRTQTAVPLELPGNGLCKQQKLRCEEPVPETSGLVIESPKKPARKERPDPISYWAVHHSWPENFAEHNLMDSANSTNKRQRSAASPSDQDGRSRSYSQSRKNGDVPEQYTAAYERHILTKGLQMDSMKGGELVSEKSKGWCIHLQQITHSIIEPTIFPIGTIHKVINFCRNRNEAIVNRDITPIIIPSITSLYFGGDNSLEHVVDEVNADWYESCVLVGPRLRPDLAIGLSSSAFTEEEVDKLMRYRSVDNWTQVTLHLFFPFLMCEVKCGRGDLDVADRQNMHSCSVAVRALLRIEQEADKYRTEKKLIDLNGQILVFSISHDHEDARLWGHYAIIHGAKWIYYRYRIRKFDLIDNDSLLTIHNFVRNLLKSHLPNHIQRLKDALEALPALNKPPESSDLPESSGLSFIASGIALSNDNSQDDSQDRDADGFRRPSRPASLQRREGESTAPSQASLQSQLALVESRLQSQQELMQSQQALMESKLQSQQALMESQLQSQQTSMQSQQALMQSQLDKLMQQLEAEREVNRKREESQAGAQGADGQASSPVP